MIINELRHKHSLNDLLVAANMARSTWYYHMKTASRKDKYAMLKDKIREIYQPHKGRYGYRRITISLKRQRHDINHKTVQKLMSELSLKALIVTNAAIVVLPQPGWKKMDETFW